MAIKIKGKQQSTITAKRRAEIQVLLKEINKKLGAEGSVILGRDASPIIRVNTALLSFEYLLCGGIPLSRYTELYGNESTGKTLAALLVILAFQRAGKVCMVVAREEFDTGWAAALGIVVEDIIFVDAINGDRSLEVATSIIELGGIDLVVMDSIQGFQTKREAEGSIEDESFGGGGASQMWGRVMRRGYSMANQGAQTAYIGISQARTKIGAFSRNGPPDTEPTGIMAIRHWKSVSVQTKKGDALFKDGKGGIKTLMARQFKMKSKKNKTGTPDRETHYWFHFKPHSGLHTTGDGGVKFGAGVKFGFDFEEDAFRMARIYETITNAGQWYYHNGQKFAQGQEQVLTKLRADAKLLERVRAEVMERIKDDK